MIHKGIAQRDKSGNLLNEFPNIPTAAKVTGIPYATISANAGGRAASGYGYIWEYTTAEKYQPPRREAKRLRRPVVKYDRDGREVARFPSVCTAAAGSPESITTIRNHLKSGKPTRDGFTWWYLERARVVKHWENNFKKYF